MDPVTPPAFQKYTATVSEITRLNEKFRLVHSELVSPSRMSFRAGQYVILDVPNCPQRKSYSIASSPQTEHSFDLLVDIAPGGMGSLYVDQLKPGDQITFLAPFGRFIFPEPGSPQEKAEEALHFIATGSGIAPMKSFLDDLLIGRGDTRPMYLFWGSRYAEDQFWYDEFEQLATQHPNFVFHPVLSRPPEEWPLCKGHVTDCLSVHTMSDFSKTGYYVCGNKNMILDVIAMLREKGVADERVHHETFY
jgi:phenol hydroxylase P5 protein